MDILAEGVENATQISFLETQHCDKFQGHYFSKPVSVNQIEDLLNGIKK
jgi:EAL domain-containing protein (putative c-di-GMP-specific phosphodiesterase class I)